MYTIDASVWVNGFDRREPGHEHSQQLLDHLKAHAIPIIVPNLVVVEVAGAISRTRQNPAQAQDFAIALSRLPNVTLLLLDEPLAAAALDLAAQHGLRGADAVYAAVAIRSGGTLISLDQEHLTRLVGIVPTRTPAEALTELVQVPPAAESLPAE